MPVSETKGKIVLNLDASEASSDRLKYGRLKKLTEKGAEIARKEIVKMENSHMFSID